MHEDNCSSPEKRRNGKSTSCLNLARCLSLKGKRVLIVDLDDQKNSTQSIPFENKTAHTVDEVLVNDKLSVKDAVTAASWNGVKVIAESPNLSGVIRELDGEVGSHLVLKEKLDEVKADFDFCLIDTSPSLNILVVNALYAADFAFIPLGKFVYLYIPENIAADRIFAKASKTHSGKWENLPAYIAEKEPETEEDCREIFHRFYIERSNIYSGIADCTVELGNNFSSSKDGNLQKIISALEQ